MQDLSIQSFDQNFQRFVSIFWSYITYLLTCLLVDVKDVSPRPCWSTAVLPWSHAPPSSPAGQPETVRVSQPAREQERGAATWGTSTY